MTKPFALKEDAEKDAFRSKTKVTTVHGYLTDAPSNTEIRARAKEISQENYKQDIKDIIRILLESPVSDDGKVMPLDGVTSIKEFKNKNTDVRTRMMLQIGLDAMRGDIKAAEFLMKYGGFEPPKEQNITVNIPQIIDDLPTRIINAIPEEEDEDDTVSDNTGNAIALGGPGGSDNL